MHLFNHTIKAGLNLPFGVGGRNQLAINPNGLMQRGTACDFCAYTHGFSDAVAYEGTAFKVVVFPAIGFALVLRDKRDDK